MSVNIPALNSLWGHAEHIQRLQQDPKPPIENLVCEGGGVKAFAFIGALQVLEEKGLLQKIQRVAGSSAGGIVAALIAIGYTPNEMEKILKEGLDLKKIIDSRTKVDPTRFFKFKGLKVGLSNIWHLFKHKGFFKGKAFTKLLEKIIQEKLERNIKDLIEENNKNAIEALINNYRAQGLSEEEINKKLNDFKEKEYQLFLDKYRIEDLGKITFIQLEKINQDHPSMKFKELYVTGTCLSDGNQRVFCAKTDPHMPIALAVRITMSFPFAFEPVLYQGDYYADGGIPNNVPMNIFEQERFLSHGLNQAGVNPCTLGLLVDSKEEIESRWGIKTEKEFNFKNLIKGIISSINKRMDLLKANYDTNLIQIYDEQTKTLDFNLNNEKIEKLITSGRGPMEAYVKYYLDSSVQYSNLPDYDNIFEKYYSKKPPELIRILDQEIGPLSKKLKLALAAVNKQDVKKQLKLVNEKLSTFDIAQVNKQEKLLAKLIQATAQLAARTERQDKLEKVTLESENKRKKIWKSIDNFYKQHGASAQLNFLYNKDQEAANFIESLNAEKNRNKLEINQLKEKISALKKNEIHELLSLIDTRNNLSLFKEEKIIEKIKKTEQMLDEHMDVILSVLSTYDKNYPDPRISEVKERQVFEKNEIRLKELSEKYHILYHIPPSVAKRSAKAHNQLIEELNLFGIEDEKAIKIAENTFFPKTFKPGDKFNFEKHLIKESEKKNLFLNLLIEEMVTSGMISIEDTNKIDEIKHYWSNSLEKHLNLKQMDLSYAAYLARRKTKEFYDNDLSQKSQENEDFLYVNALKDNIKKIKIGAWGDYISFSNRNDIAHNIKHMQVKDGETYGKNETNHSVTTISHKPKKVGKYLSFKKKYKHPIITAHILTPAKTAPDPSPKEIIVAFDDPLANIDLAQYALISKHAHSRQGDFNQVKKRLIKQLRWRLQDIHRSDNPDEKIHITLVGEGLAGQDAQYMLHALVEEMLSDQSEMFKKVENISLLTVDPSKVSLKISEDMAEKIHLLKQANPDLNIKGYNLIHQKAVGGKLFRYRSQNFAGDSNILSKLDPSEGEVTAEVRDLYDPNYQYRFISNQTEKEKLDKILNKKSIIYSNFFLRNTKLMALKIKSAFKYIALDLFPKLLKTINGFSILGTLSKKLIYPFMWRKKALHKLTQAKSVPPWSTRLEQVSPEKSVKVNEKKHEAVNKLTLADEISALLKKTHFDARLKKSERPPIENLVLEGGGIKVGAYAGALEKMESNGMAAQLQRIAGSSSGGIVAGLSAVGYSGIELAKLFHEEFVFKKMLEKPLLSKLQTLFEINKVKVTVSGLFSLFKNKGLYKGKIFKLFLANLLKEKLESSLKSFIFDQLTEAEKALLLKVPPGLSPSERDKRIDAYLERGIEDVKKKYAITDLGKITFKQLSALKKDFPDFNLKDLYVTGTNVSDGSLKIFSAETEPDCPIVEAMRITMSSPGLLAPVKYKGDYFVDGSVASTYPMEIFDEPQFLTHGLNDKGVNPCTLGILVDSQAEIEHRWGIKGSEAPPTVELSKAVGGVLTGLRNRAQILHQKYDINSIQIVDNIAENETYEGALAWDLELNPTKKQRLLDNGKQAIDFYDDNYIRGEVAYHSEAYYQNLFHKYFTKPETQLKEILNNEILPYIEQFEVLEAKINQTEVLSSEGNAENKADLLKLIGEFNEAKDLIFKEKALILRALKLKEVSDQKVSDKRKKSSILNKDKEDVPSILTFHKQNGRDKYKKYNIQVAPSPSTQELIPFETIINLYKVIFDDYGWQSIKKGHSVEFRSKFNPEDRIKITSKAGGINISGQNSEQLINMLLLYQDMILEKKHQLTCSMVAASLDDMSTLLEGLQERGFDLKTINPIRCQDTPDGMTVEAILKNKPFRKPFN